MTFPDESAEGAESLTQQLPDRHDWNLAHRADRLAFRCPACEVTVPVTAADTQAGIRLYCPECNQEMDLNAE